MLNQIAVDLLTENEINHNGGLQNLESTMNSVSRLVNMMNPQNADQIREYEMTVVNEFISIR